ncbi:PH, RCC1 and FYVE domains-containing protein 1 [Raphanus sativus]|uniref:PH, RCC1 and FYVE domains-containing protein 1 n=1 Tax=Raphanus sativus TaxID=3726 RepID=A0A6J0LB70_RAPSA|nr:PH, RCC1 and FYVE domains-containing protein 1 [Raphanus sativus]
MADLVSYGSFERDIEQALIALKKGAQLLKYGRKGKPKFCPFRLSNDETSLIWISNGGEKRLKLSTVSKIVPGQRTAVFQRYLRPDKDYLSFSLIYSNRKRTLDVICKDKVEAEVWIAGLKALISGQGGRAKIDGWSDGLSIADSRDLTLGSPTNSSVCASRDFNSVDTTPYTSTTFSKSIRTENSVSSERSHVAPSGSPNMSVRGPSTDVFRVSVSSAQSTSSHGSGPEDRDALGDVYLWGEVPSGNSNNNVRADKNNAGCVVGSKSNVLVPKPLESNVVLDVHQISCGVKHAALVSRQGEVFTWGEESGGRLGHGMGKDVTGGPPQLIESLAVSSVDFVACGEFHTCAVTMSGEIYTWGDGTHNAGLLGHGTDVSHWIPKRVSGPLEGLRIASVSCGPWHTALITSTGHLFTFGDGTFGVLGHGDRETVFYPREVKSLSGLKTVAVACGVWHSAAVVEVIVTTATQSSSSSSGKLFTWGDGDKGRLGHGDKESRLKPTCVSALIDYDFHKAACGHSLTVGLTTSGRVFTMGSTVYGQLGNPNPTGDGKLPCLVEGRLSNDCVEEVACGAYHVAVLTSRNEVFTWGRGANGRLGHGDVEDRNAPTLVEALRDRHVKYIACGDNFTAAICLHKWASGAEQTQCSACKQAFGFTKKSHNCYNCGLVHCHSCSSKKSLKASLAPNPGKPYRVCDSCYSKLSKASEGSVMPRLSGENKDRLDKAELRLARSGIPSSKIDLIKQLDSRAARQGGGRKGGETFSLVRTSQTPLSQLRDALSNVADLRRVPPKPAVTPSGGNSRSVSPFSRRTSPTRSVTPIPSMGGLGFSASSVTESLKKTNELLNQEVVKLRAQAESLRQRCEVQELEVQKSVKKAQEAMKLASEETAKSEAAKEVIKSLTTQLKDIVKLLPPGAHEAEITRTTNLLNGFHFANAKGQQRSSRSDSTSDTSSLASPLTPPPSRSMNGLWRSSQSPRNTDASTGRDELQSDGVRHSNGFSEDGDTRRNSRSSVATSNASQVEAEWIEQYEPGVYITLLALGDGTRDLKRVRFSRRRFKEQQAEAWWTENRERVYEKYTIRGTDRPSVQSQFQT